MQKWSRFSGAVHEDKSPRILREQGLHVAVEEVAGDAF